MVTDVHKIYCGDYLAIYKNIESLCFTTETNIMCVNCTSVKRIRITDRKFMKIHHMLVFKVSLNIF